jgi:hypothetical protein
MASPTWADAAKTRFMRGCDMESQPNANGALHRRRLPPALQMRNADERSEANKERC